jgi:hypothetical protein
VGNLPTETMVNLTALTRLRIAGNDFSGPLPSELREQLPKLTDLRVYNNRFEEHTVSRFVTMRTVSKAKFLE